MPGVEAAIEVRELRKSYPASRGAGGAIDAVRGIDFSVARGEIFGLLGPNGAGKTTTVEILEGYRQRTAGAVSVLGFDPSERPRELRARVGIVLQSSGIYAHATVAELLAHFAGDVPWAHIDIAGTGFDVKTPYIADTGATGFGVRLMVEIAAKLAA